MRRSYGWSRQPRDPRDWQFRPHPRMMLTVNSVMDISNPAIAYLNQGGAGTCGPNSASEVWMGDQRGEGMPIVPVSRLFIYWYTRQLMGTLGQDSGVDNRTMLKALAQFGAPPESLMPYSDSLLNEQPPQAAISAAVKIQNYSAVTLALPPYQGAIASGLPIIHGFDCYQQIESDQAAATGIIADPPAGASPIGGHDMSLWGINASNVDQSGVMPGNKWPAGTVKLRQHWVNADGSLWGDGGYGYMSFAYAFGPHNSDPWVINSVPNGAPPTPPAPPAPPGPNPPPPPAPVGPPSPAQIVAVIDSAFATVEGRVNPVLRPLVVPALQYANRLVDAAVTTYLTQSRRRIATAPAWGQLIISAIDGAFAGVEHELGSVWSPLLEMARGQVDAELTQLLGVAA